MYYWLLVPMSMTEACVLKALRSKTKSLSLDNSQMKVVPPSLGQLDFLVSLSIKNNRLQALPGELARLDRLTYLNLGRNHFAEIPDCLCTLTSLQTLHLFGNSISVLPDKLFLSLQHIILLNLNENLLSSLPPSVSFLRGLQRLSLSGNTLSHLPRDIGSLSLLRELHLDGNRIQMLPTEIGNLRKLEKLFIQKNQLEEIPSSVRRCCSLTVLDVSCNQLQLFPPELSELHLREFYFEANPLLPPILVPAEQQEEILPLREMAARVIMKEIRDHLIPRPPQAFIIASRSRKMSEAWERGYISISNSLLLAAIGYYPEVMQSLEKGGKCAVCGEPFVNSWLECVQFQLTRKLFPLCNKPGVIPVRAPLCSYKCFNSDGHQFFGVAVS